MKAILQVIADTITEPPRVQDSGLGSELRIPSPTFNTLQDTLSQLVTISYSSDPDLEPIITLRTPQPLSPETPFKTPPDVTPGSPIKNSSSDTSLSFQTPTEVSPGNQSPVEKVPSVSFPSKFLSVMYFYFQINTDLCFFLPILQGYIEVNIGSLKLP